MASSLFHSFYCKMNDMHCFHSYNTHLDIMQINSDLMAVDYTISGRPPPVASMVVGQFFNPEEGRNEFSPKSFLLSVFSEKVSSFL
ncbi:hypothetical protein Hanom_Chr08g00700871 [Helianthus anomalus]